MTITLSTSVVGLYNATVLTVMLIYMLVTSYYRPDKKDKNTHE